MGTGEGVGTGVGVGTKPFGRTVYPAELGAWKSATFMPLVALAMKSCQISAGIDPPNTSGNPSTLYIGLSNARLAELLARAASVPLWKYLGSAMASGRIPGTM